MGNIFFNTTTNTNTITTATRYSYPIPVPNSNTIAQSAPAIDIPLFSPVKEQTAPSLYTAQGKRKATKCDPIRSMDDVQRVAEYFRTTGRPSLRLRNYCLFLLGVSTGIRACDLVRVRIDDIFNPDWTIKSRLVIYEQKTGKMNYPVINNNPTLTNALYAYIATPNVQNQIAEGTDPYLFSNNRNGHVTENMVLKLMQAAMTTLQLPYHLGAHSLRKTFAYHTIKLHADNVSVLATLQQMLNHSSMNTTLAYAGITDEDKEVMYSDIAKVFTDKENGNTSDSLENKIDRLINIMSNGDDEI